MLQKYFSLTLYRFLLFHIFKILVKDKLNKTVKEFENVNSSRNYSTSWEKPNS